MLRREHTRTVERMALGEGSEASKASETKGKKRVGRKVGVQDTRRERRMEKKTQGGNGEKRESESG